MWHITLGKISGKSYKPHDKLVDHANFRWGLPAIYTWAFSSALSYALSSPISTALR